MSKEKLVVVGNGMAGARAVEEVLARDFAGQLESRDRRFLLRLTRMLLEQGGMVHEVLQHFARSLRHFVQSREYLEQRRFNHLLKDAQRAALSLKDEVQTTKPGDDPLLKKAVEVVQKRTA